MANIVAFPRTDAERSPKADPTSDAVFTRCLLESSTECIKVLDLDARLTFMSAGGLCAMEIDDFTPFEGTHWPDFWTGEDKERALEAVVTARAGGVGRFQGFCQTAKGTPKWWDVVVSSLPGPDGKPERLLSISRDVSDLRNALTELVRRDERYSLVTRVTNEAIWDAAVGQDEVLWSETTAGLFRYRPEEVQQTGTWWRARIHPEDRERVLARVQDVFARAESQWSHEYRFQRGDGTYAHVLDRGCVLRDEGSKPVRYLGAMQDISAQRRLEEQLRQAQKMEAMGQLTGGVAHDFNNLLTVIVGNAEALAEDPSDPRLTSTLSKQILDAAERGADLTHKLLAFGRRQSLKPERLRLDEVAAHMVPLIHRSIGEHIEVETKLRAGALAALTDRTLLESAILNLAVNARDAMPKGGTLTMSTGERIAGRSEGPLPIGQPVVFMTVSDTGTGMSPDVLSRVFEPFFTTKDVGKGSGLGLSMVYGFAQQCGGHVSIESQEGVGTSVTLVLPAIAHVAQPSHEHGSQKLLKKRTGRVLLVEDEAPVLQFVCGQLINLGYEVETVSNGPDALRLLRQDRNFDLLFTDVMLPKGMSGIEVAREARAIKPDLKVLLTSGYPEEVFQHHGRPDPDTLLLRKPYRRKQLADTLVHAFEGNHTGDALGLAV
jgi:PAS domain S-box-containing protein